MVLARNSWSTTPEAQARIESMTNMPIGLLEKKRRSKSAATSGVIAADGHVGDVVDADGAGVMKAFEQTRLGAADLHWLATLLTGCREIAVDVTVQSYRFGR